MFYAKSCFGLGLDHRQGVRVSARRRDSGGVWGLALARKSSFFSLKAVCEVMHVCKGYSLEKKRASDDYEFTRGKIVFVVVVKRC